MFTTSIDGIMWFGKINYEMKIRVTQEYIKKFPDTTLRKNNTIFYIYLIVDHKYDLKEEQMKENINEVINSIVTDERYKKEAIKLRNMNLKKLEDFFPKDPLIDISIFNNALSTKKNVSKKEMKFSEKNAKYFLCDFIRYICKEEEIVPQGTIELSSVNNYNVTYFHHLGFVKKSPNSKLTSDVSKICNKLDIPPVINNSRF